MNFEQNEYIQLGCKIINNYFNKNSGLYSLINGDATNIGLPFARGKKEDTCMQRIEYLPAEQGIRN